MLLFYRTMVEQFDARDNKMSHCKRELVEVIQNSYGRSDCLFCFRPLNGLISICNHLSRRVECREYYCQELLPFINEPAKIREVQASHEKLYPKNPKSVPNNLIADSRADLFKDDSEDSIHSPSHQPFLSSPITRNMSLASAPKNTFSNDNLNGDRKSQVLQGKRNRKRSYSPVYNNNGAEHADSEEIIVAPEEELISKAYLIRNPVQCAKCGKVFRGKTPAVAYNNHRRNKHCPMSSSRKMTLKQGRPPKSVKKEKPVEKKKIIRASDEPTFEDQPKKIIPNTTSIQYYCKLCPNQEVTSRVSLTLHLMVVHGLPSVYVNTGDETVLNCQSCSRTFYSKYKYNLHRFDCDLRSPYVGIVKESLPKVVRTLKSFLKTGTQMSSSKS